MSAESESLKALRETMNARSNQETERAPVHALADACQLLVAAIEQINASCQTREQRAALGVGRAALAALQRLEHAGDTTHGEGDQCL